MPENDTKTTLLQWVIKSLPFPVALACAVLAIILTIVELPLLGAVDTNVVAGLIVLNGAVCLLCVFIFKSLKRDKSYYQHGGR